MAKVWFDEGHEEVQRVSDSGNEGMSSLAEALGEFGLEVLSGPIDTETFSDLATLVLCFPTKEFTPEEVSAIRVFVDGGGGLLLTGEWGNLYRSRDVLNPLLEGSGTQFIDDRVTDKEHAVEKEVRFMGEVIDTKKVPQFVRISDLDKEHPVTKDLTEIVYYAGCSLQVGSGVAIAQSSPSSFGDRDADRKVGDDESKGSMVVATAQESNKGRIVCVGDSSFMANKYIGGGDNRAFALNIINWLTRSI
jgi:uncharacterized protein DUF4350